MEQALRNLRRQRDLANEHGEPDRAALLHLLIVIEELTESVGDLHERVVRLERRAVATAAGNPSRKM